MAAWIKRITWNAEGTERFRGGEGSGNFPWQHLTYKCAKLYSAVDLNREDWYLGQI